MFMGYCPLPSTLRCFVELLETLLEPSSGLGLWTNFYQIIISTQRNLISKTEKLLMDHFIKWPKPFQRVGSWTMGHFPKLNLKKQPIKKFKIKVFIYLFSHLLGEQLNVNKNFTILLDLQCNFVFQLLVSRSMLYTVGQSFDRSISLQSPLRPTKCFVQRNSPNLSERVLLSPRLQ
jgi:hypothetical protein